VFINEISEWRLMLENHEYASHGAVTVLMLGGRLIHGSCILVIISDTKAGVDFCGSTYMREYIW